MSSSAASSTVLLNRILTLKESSPFVLALDNIGQSSHYLTNEFIYKIKSTTSAPVSILYLSYETTNKPEYADEFLLCLGKPLSYIKDHLSKKQQITKTLIIVDSFNYITDDDLSEFLATLFSPNTTIYGTYHLSVPTVKNHQTPNLPSLLTRLQFVATTIFEIKPILIGIDEEEMEHAISNFDLPIDLSNSSKFEVELTYRRASGRSLIYQFTIDTITHTYELKQNDSQKDQSTNENELLENLTTFNLTTTQKQKLARDQVDLPFLEAQQSMGSMGGAIVYEFEKDDDYDEEDPYEDPF
ncbi:hypothetical protein CANARDRAFT_28623 [[Candida] arabinofermentans NRRL YB-2248]|uniref:Elongator complex protein 5 n=1 Tax=[Candida] arabinofermentans NRRL YB-2248 TaxID=983967 RepID=A0A1E4SZJ7_9ASCO|nr:hypothetical protein CANARDRAFT_28623 [[Candida] arabinofermentans NRRL YB-2248]